MKISLCVLFTICLLFLTSACPAAGADLKNMTDEERIAYMATQPYVSIESRLDPAHLPPGWDTPCQGECTGIIMVFTPGDRIEFHGENTATDKTCLFLTGPGLPEDGAQIHKPDPAKSPVASGNPDTFAQASVRSDHTWSWTWDTTGTILEDGTYTVYAASLPNGLDTGQAVTCRGLFKINIKNSPGSATTTRSTPVATPTATTPSATPPTTPPSENEEEVLPGVVTIIAAGDPNHYIGDEIQFTGTNTAGWKTYLFITGPGLAANGSQIHTTDPKHTPVENGNPATFKQMDVQGNQTWSWRWGTANTALDPGTYTIYATARPYDKDNLEKTPYGTTSITIRKPPESTTPAAPVMTPAKSPGYGFLIALIGLGAVAVIAIRGR